jgi:hypothetical protein
MRFFALGLAIVGAIAALSACGPALIGPDIDLTVGTAPGSPGAAQPTSTPAAPGSPSVVGLRLTEGGGVGLRSSAGFGVSSFAIRSGPVRRTGSSAGYSVTMSASLDAPH